MAINRIDFPASTPVAAADYQAQNTLIQAAFRKDYSIIPYSGTAMSIGFVFNIADSVYMVETATAITGTEGYLKITPSGATATASFVSSLTGVSWNSLYGGYYDGSGNRYFYKYTPGSNPLFGGLRYTDNNPATSDGLLLGLTTENGFDVSKSITLGCYGKVRLFLRTYVPSTGVGFAEFKKNGVSIYKRQAPSAGSYQNNEVDVFISPGDIISIRCMCDVAFQSSQGSLLVIGVNESIYQ